MWDKCAARPISAGAASANGYTALQGHAWAGLSWAQALRDMAPVYPPNLPVGPPGFITPTAIKTA